MSDDPRLLVRRLSAELIDRRNLDVIATAFDPAFVSHTSGDDLDRDAFATMLAQLLTALPDASVVTELVLADGDLVAWRSVTTGTHEQEWLGIPATGRAVSWSAIHIARLRGGRVLEHWGSPDILGLLSQLRAGPD
jgi:predicted ester cyclase